MAGNAGHAIDLRDAPPAPTPANGGIGAPSLTSASDAKTAMRVAGTAPITPGNIPVVVDVYASRSCGPSDHEAERWIGQLTVTNGRFDGALPLPPWGLDHLTATSADGQGDTSELSACTPMRWLRPAPNPLPPPPVFPPVLPFP
jgi:hypothetical protein